MGLDDWTDTDDSADQPETTEEPDNDEAQSTKKAIAANIQSRCMTHDLDVEIDGGTVTGNIEDLAMMFALMTMDFKESEFQELVTDDVE